MRIRATIEAGGKTATGIRIPPSVVDALGSGKRPKVKVTVNGHTYRSSIASLGGVFMLGVSDEVRKAAGVAAGDVVDVDLELDTEPREVTVAPDFAAALDAEPEARRTFDRLNYSQRRWFAEGIDGAKTPETRERRIVAAVARLREGRGQR